MSLADPLDPSHRGDELVAEQQFASHLEAECARLASQCAALITLLHEARPLVKGRLADDPSHGDPALLERIAAALDP